MALRLLSDGHAVRGLMMRGDPQRDKIKRVHGLEVAEGDLRSSQDCIDAVEGVDLVIHLAAQLVRGDTPVDEFFDVNALGTLRLLEAVAHRSHPLKRFVLASTDGVFRPGRPPEVPIRETSPQLPGDYYGTSKLLGEIILRNYSYQYEIPFSIVRFGSVVSPEESPAMFRRAWLLSILRREALGRSANIWPLFVDHPGLADSVALQVTDSDTDSPVVVYGPDDRCWSVHVVDVRDAVQGVMLCAFHDSAVGEDFIVAGPATTSFQEGAGVISELSGIGIRDVRLPTGWNLDLDITKATMLLGFSPQYSFADTVQAASASDGEVIPARLPQ